MPYEHIYQTMPQEMTRAMRRVMLVNGVDMMGGRAFLVSSAHEEEVIDRTLEAFSAIQHRQRCPSQRRADQPGRKAA